MTARVPRFGSDDSGVFAVGAFGAGARELRQLAEAAESIAKCASGRRLVLVHEGCTLEEMARFAKLAKSVPDRVLSVADAPGVADTLESRGLYVWKVAGAEGCLFATVEPPDGSPRLLPVSKQEDFPRARPRTATLITKAAAAMPERQLVYGIVLEPDTTDSQGDVYSAAEIELACHRYLEDFQNVGHMHESLINGSAAVVESYIAPVDFTMGDQTVKAGTWMICVHVLNDDLWSQVKEGKLTGFSIGGWAQRIPVA